MDHIIRPRRGNRRRRGNVLVEGSFAIVPLMALVLAVIDVSFAIFVRNTMEFAVRQGVRYAVTSQTMTGLGQDDSIRTTVENATMGLLDSMSPNHNGMKQISITYYDPVSLLPVVGVNSNIGGNIVVVSASGLSWAWMAPLWRDSKAMQFSVSSADIMEATPLAGAPAR